MTDYQKHCARWRDGCGSEHCPKATRKVFARGRLPCDVLFVGEAPAESEDTCGSPFVGKAGHLLDQIIAAALGPDPSVSWAFTNVVACIPRGDDGKKFREPDVDQMESCQPRLTELVALADPRLVVCVGKVAREWLQRGMKASVPFPPGCQTIEIKHPAAILRGNVIDKDTDCNRCVVQIRNAVVKLAEARKGR
jgi:uracil-DNA glycosylase family 4